MVLMEAMVWAPACELMSQARTSERDTEFRQPWKISGRRLDSNAHSLRFPSLESGRSADFPATLSTWLRCKAERAASVAVDFELHALHVAVPDWYPPQTGTPCCLFSTRPIAIPVIIGEGVVPCVACRRAQAGVHEGLVTSIIRTFG